MMQALTTSQAEQVLGAAPVGIAVLDADRNVTWANALLHTFVGLGDGELTGKNFAQATGPLMQRVVGQEGLYYVAAAGARAERWLHCRDQAIERGAAKYFTDVTELRRVQALQEKIAGQLQELATIDPSTGLFTARALMQNLDPLVSRSRRYNNPLSVLVMSVAGTSAGAVTAQVMLAVGYMLKDQLRWADIISRTGNSEFVMVLPETSAEQTQKLVDKIKTNLVSLPVADTPGGALSVDARFGVASWQKGDDAQQLLQRAQKEVG
jgi:diguanylate cyclase (GGDEF)-like protein